MSVEVCPSLQALLFASKLLGNLVISLLIVPYSPLPVARTSLTHLYARALALLP